ncbi:hypothetical protein ACFL60_05820 [Candidatus Omnitrophota bacterium]
MKKERNLEYYMNLEYTFLLKKKRDSFVFFIPELQIFSEAKTINEAYENLDEEKEKYFQKILEFEAHDIVKKPISHPLVKSIFSETVSYIADIIKPTLKISTALFIITLLGYVLIMPLTNKFINVNMSKIAYSGMLQVAKIMKIHISMSDELKESKIENLRKYIQEIKPFVDEIKVLWEEEENGKPEP